MWGYHGQVFEVPDNKQTKNFSLTVYIHVVTKRDFHWAVRSPGVSHHKRSASSVGHLVDETFWPPCCTGLTLDSY